MTDLLTTRAERKARGGVLSAQLVASLGLATGAAAGGLLAEHVVGGPSAAGAPLGALVLGAGAAALPLSRIMAARGRVLGLRIGYLVAAVGAAVVLLAAVSLSLPLLVAGNFLVGAGNSSVMLSRYVLADMAGPHGRARAMGTSMLAVAAGAVLGPALLGPSAALSSVLGLPDAAGLYVLALLAFLAAPGLLTAFPDGVSQAGVRHVRETLSENVRDRRRLVSSSAVYGALVLGAANLTMASMMVVVPVHLHHSGSGLHGVGMVVSIHVAAMFVASPLIGRLVDRFGSRPVAVTGGVVLVLVGLLPSLVSVHSLATASGLLILLGLGWSTQVIAGSAMLTNGLPLGSRATGEAAGEIAMSAGAALGCLVLAGPLSALGGLALLAAAAVPLNLALVLALSLRRLHGVRAVPVGAV
ncbi:MAG TPA: MFS transporter [Nocardioidaceae bacterium]|nr:MFS transporter [Nocardioidaceae bacterium]